MWAIRNETPYAAGKTWVRDRDGGHQWIVAVKATFRIVNGRSLSLIDEQPEPLLAPVFNGEDGLSSLRYEAELTAMKPSTDVVVNGRAHAPRGRPVTELAIGLRLGRLRKTLLVRGPNVFYRSLAGWSTTSPRPFTTMPVVFERAYGGADLEDPDPRQKRMDLRNPVGVGVAATPSKLENTPGPNIVYAGRDLARAGPAGFGAIACHWSPRAELAGTYDDTWERTRKPLLPQDYDPRSLLCAPPDQRLDGYLVGDEVVEVVNMCPRGVTRFELPRVTLGFETWFGRRSQRHVGHLVLVLVEPDEERATLVWQTCHPVMPTMIDYLDHTIISGGPLRR